MITSRPIAEADQAFLRELYASTRAAEMAIVPWSAAEKHAFLGLQFDAQHAFYMEQFPDARFDLVLESGSPLAVSTSTARRRAPADRHHLVAGMSGPRPRLSRLSAGVLDDAAAAGKQVRIHVEKNNPALHLYERLGFATVEDQGVYDLMEWRPRRPAAAARGGRS